jgi:predicted PurR-regulated permease PerM
MPSTNHTDSHKLTRLLLILLGLGALLLLVDALRPMLSPFIVGALVAYLFDPLADRLQRAKFSRTLASTLITVIIFGSLILLVMWLGPLLAEQALALAQALPEMIQNAKFWLVTHSKEWTSVWSDYLPFSDQPGEIAMLGNGASQQATNTVSQLITRLANSGMALVNVLALLLITPVVCFYLLRDYDLIVTRIDTLLPKRYQQTIREQMRAIDNTLAAYLRGQLQVMMILSVYYGISLAILGVPYALVIGLVSGIMILIPYLGTLISTALALGVAYSHASDPSLVLWALGIYGIGQILENQILVPKLVGGQVGLHPLWVLFGLLAGGVLFGFIGILLAVPVTAVIGVLIKFAVKRYQQSSLYHDA